ncbi:uncharacterized protein [Misgurnus anguillicaudatus]|uniref:uncharacterized protein n=1 Tax=Misgurnus anguillicaudatus TaxID=75329 RepID=UPI003CCF04B3
MSDAKSVNADLEGLEVKSEWAASSSSSRRSSRSSIAAAQARAKAEGARKRATFAKREIEMQVEKARIEATLNALKEECEAEAASAEAEVLEALVKAEESESERKGSHVPSIHRSINRTEEYIQNHFSHRDDKTPQSASACNHSQMQCHTDLASQLPVATNANSTDVLELVTYLSRRDLITSGLKVFDSQPASYLSWKSSFNNAVEGLSLKPSEELDLIIKWLGGESLQHAKRIRAVHVNNPAEGLEMVWRRLDRSYGSPEAIEAFLFSRMYDFPKLSIKDSKKLLEFSDLLLEILAAKKEEYLQGLNFLDTARGINPILEKLPYSIQEQWISKGSRYKREHCVAYPPFSVFVDFVCEQAEMRNDPSFFLSTSSTAFFRGEKQHPSKIWKPNAPFSVNRTEVENPYSVEHLREDPDKECPLHKMPHSLKRCRAFRGKSFVERKRFLLQHSICFRCCASTAHQAKDCKAVVQCEECNSERHISALHPGPAPWIMEDLPVLMDDHSGEQSEGTPVANTSMCTEVCGERFCGKSCSKICLVNVYPKGQSEKKVRMYVLLDDQSNVSLARSAFFDIFKIQGDVCPYMLKTCSGMTESVGRRASGFVVESLDGEVCLSLPTLTECDLIPNNRDEIPTPEIAHNHIHLQAVADQIPPLDHNAEILLLLGRDIIQVHKVRAQCNGRHNDPFAQQLDLGWVIIGNVCLNGAHIPTVSSCKTNLLWNGRPSYLTPCENNIFVKVQLSADQNTPIARHKPSYSDVGTLIFKQEENDFKFAASVEDELFLQIMNQEFQKDDTGSWEAPLPFRIPRQRLPNNRRHALNRLMSLSRTLKKNAEMKDHFIDFMKKIFENKHAEEAPLIQGEKECWYLPSFGVYHPKKPGQIRIVFDSSAWFEGVSLNDVLLRGPDLNNSLLGVLMRFRTEPVAVTTDIQQMFHSFLVKEDHRDYLRFLWFRNHQLDGEIMEYRMRVHVFGNCPSPAVAIYGLKRTAMEGERQFGAEARKFIDRHFYVDDGLKSFPTVEEAVSVVKAAQEMLAQSNLRLHKIASNKLEFMKAFPAVDLAKGLQDIDVGQDLSFEQRSLGLKWDLVGDTFTFQVADVNKPYTRRGVLSTINSLFDPLGFAAPVSIQGRKILRDLSIDACDWDEPLPNHKFAEWQKWCTSLQDLKDVKVPRMYTTISHLHIQEKEVCIFCDASTKAIAAVAYLKVRDTDGQIEVGFIFGKTKLVPKPDLTIPRLELCAAVLAVEVAEVISEELDIEMKKMKFFTDSKVVLGYISNESRRFYVYVNNRVQRIRRSTEKYQWHYVQTDLNPADCGTRAVSANQLTISAWLTGPAFLSHMQIGQPLEEAFELIHPESDVEVRHEVTSCLTKLSPHLGSVRFERFSSWTSALRAVARLSHIAQSFLKSLKQDSCRGWHMCKEPLNVAQREDAKIKIILAVQTEIYAEERENIKQGKPVQKQSSLVKLCPFIDSQGVLRVGGRLSKIQLPLKEVHPIIIPGRHHITSILIKYYHEKVCHQGRHFTEGAVRAAGYWIVGGKRPISSVIYNCIVCRKIRGRLEEQKMADLPVDRLSTDPPFTYVGLDVFGPWSVVTRRTRGGQSNSKRWAVIFTCMSTRAIHIEVIEAMDASSFINALRRFFAIRGPVKQLRSDCGTNFIGASRELQLDSTCAYKSLESYLSEQGCTWVFNLPHSSHMGGSWERMIGVSRRILDAMFLQFRSKQLTHEVLTTFMAEVTAIVNSRPLTSVSSDPEQPLILTPSMLLTQKIGAHTVPPGQFDERDLYKRQWRQVQHLANEFWKRWRSEYICSLQKRRKWTHEKVNMQEGDLVLLRDIQVKRQEWPIGLITKTFPSDDGKVRKIEVKTVREGVPKLFLRPISEVILLLSKEGKDFCG